MANRDTLVIPQGVVGLIYTIPATMGMQLKRNGGGQRYAEKAINFILLIYIENKTSIFMSGNEK